MSVANDTATKLDITSSTGSGITLLSATTTKAGLLSASDKIKLNATSNTNTGDETANTIYTKFKDNIVAGNNIALVKNDSAGTITISSTGGGGGTGSYDPIIEYANADISNLKTLHFANGGVFLDANGKMVLFN